MAAGAGLEAIAPNILLFLVLRECNSDIPTLFPTFDAKNASFDRALAPDLQCSDGTVASLAVATTSPYSIAAEPLPGCPGAGSGSDDNSTPNRERIHHD